jgi:hypothetical protein
MNNEFLKQAFERQFTTKSDRLIEIFYSEVPHIGRDNAMRRHLERWRRLRLWYTRHPGCDKNSTRYIKPLPYVDEAEALRAIKLLRG